MGEHVEIIAIGHTDNIVSYEMHVPGSTTATRCCSCELASVMLARPEHSRPRPRLSCNAKDYDKK